MNCSLSASFQNTKMRDYWLSVSPFVQNTHCLHLHFSHKREAYQVKLDQLTIVPVGSIKYSTQHLLSFTQLDKKCIYYPQKNIKLQWMMVRIPLMHKLPKRMTQHTALISA